MKQSTVPKIRNLVRLHLNFEDYWNDISEIDKVLEINQRNQCSNYVYNYELNNNLKFIKFQSEINIPQFIIEPIESTKEASKLKEKLLKFYKKTNRKEKIPSQSLISPVLSFFSKFSSSQTPNTFFIDKTPLKINLSTHKKVSSINREQSDSLIKENCNLLPLSLQR